MRREFAVEPTPKRAYAFLLAIGGAPLLGVLVGAALHASEGPLLLAVAAVLAAVVLGLWLAMRRVAVILEDDALVVRAALHTLRVPRAALLAAQARIVDLTREPGLRPRFKTLAFDVPGFQAGHYRGRPWSQRMFCLLTRRERVLLLPESGGRRLLLSVQRPRDLLQALQESPA